MANSTLGCGIDGIGHVEIFVPNAHQAADYYRTALGFTILGPRRSADATVADRTTVVVRQGRIVLFLTAPLNPTSEVARHICQHGEGIKDIAFTTASFDAVLARAAAHGAQPVAASSAAGRRRARVSGPDGPVVHTILERAPGRSTDTLEVSRSAASSDGLTAGLLSIDHVALAVRAGTLDRSVAFYADVFGFVETHQESVATEHSAMRSKVVQSPDGSVRFPMMEPAPGRRRSQIDNYIDAHDGPGVQHLAFLTADIVASMSRLAGHLDFLPTPAPYYDALEERVGRLSTELPALRRAGILADRDATGMLLQVFTKPIGPRPTLFLELIERRGAEGFGGGNIKALFEAVERATPVAALV